MVQSYVHFRESHVECANTVGGVSRTHYTFAVSHNSLRSGNMFESTVWLEVLVRMDGSSRYSSALGFGKS